MLSCSIMNYVKTVRSADAYCPMKKSCSKEPPTNSSYQEHSSEVHGPVAVAAFSVTYRPATRNALEWRLLWAT